MVQIDRELVENDPEGLILKNVNPELAKTKLKQPKQWKSTNFFQVDPLPDSLSRTESI